MATNEQQCRRSNRTSKKKVIFKKLKKISLDKNEILRFIKNVYPRSIKEEWKNNIKKDIISRENNTINIVYLCLPKYGYAYNERKKIIMYKGIDEFKGLIRNTYKEKVKGYIFDNVFHMTDNEIEYYDLSALIDKYLLLKEKRKDGRIILSKNLFHLIVDRVERKKYQNKNWIFKEIRKNSYEDYCELFCEEVFRRFDLPSAFYDLALLNNREGVITYDFIRNEKYKSAKELIGEMIKSDEIKNIMEYNNYNSLIEILFKYCNKYDLDISNLDLILAKIKKMMLLDILLLQSDRNPNNYGFIINEKIELSRIFDNSNAMSCNHIDRSPYNNIPLLTVKNKKNNYYKEIEDNLDFYKDIIIYIKYIESNMEDIFRSVENKINNPFPSIIKKYITKILKQHFSNIKTHI